MSYEDYPQYLRDILNSLENIQAFRAGMTVEQIRSDRKTEAAIERELQIVTEAASRLGNQAEILCPGADWRSIRGFGNMLRHAYDRLEPTMMTNVLDEDVPTLEREVRSAVSRLQRPPDTQLP